MSAPAFPPTTGAVFLSYAREDTDAARRIAEALRSHGLEVWFDQNELRGGDSWDQKIRTQINDCALFLPVISRHTQDRSKGYFRLEWKLAVEQTHLMLEGTAYLAPIVIDDTTESGAAVPAEFLRVQWTRLPGALPTPQFVEQIKRLLEPQSRAPVAAMAPKVSATPIPAARPSNLPVGVIGAIAVVAVAAALYFALRPGTPVAVPAAAVAIPVPPAAEPARPAAATDKSIAVLPFASMSSEKENEFFTEGVHEDILTNLALIRDVRVVSRTSVMQYRDTKKPISQIAQELKVAYILEGSVRRSGNKVRVTGQLIRAATDEHLWAKAYDRDLTDVFTIQGEIATAIAGALESVLTPEAKSILDRRPTDNPAAYDLFLKARQLRYGGSVTEAKGIIPLLEQAVQLDPKFAAAWADLGSRRAFNYFNIDPTAALLAKAKEAIDAAVRLAPDDPAVLEGQGDYYYYCYRDYARAAENYARLAELRPNDPALFWSMGLIERRQGRFADAWRNFQRAMELDPDNAGYAITALELLGMGRRFVEAEALGRKAVLRWPDDLYIGSLHAANAYYASGSTARMAEFARRIVPAIKQPDHLYYQRVQALMRGDWTEVLRLDRRQRHFDSEDDPAWQQDANTAMAMAEMGDLPAAQTRMREALAAMQAEETRQAGNDVLWINLALAHAFLGHKAESMRCREKAFEIMPISRDALQGAGDAVVLASALAWCGEKDRALAELARLLHVAWGANIYRERGCWLSAWKPLRDDPRFQALLADPKNNGPLF